MINNADVNRIRRGVKDASTNADSNKALNRGLSVSGNPNKQINSVSYDIQQNCEGYIGSTNVLRYIESENSEDRSSRSSTTASAPRLRYDIHTKYGYVWEKNRVKNLSGKNVVNSNQ